MLQRLILVIFFVLSLPSLAEAARYQSTASGPPRKISGSGVQVLPRRQASPPPNKTQRVVRQQAPVKSVRRKRRKRRFFKTKRVVRRKFRAKVRRDRKRQPSRPRPPRRIQSQKRPRRQQRAYQRQRSRKPYRATSRKIPRAVPPTAPVILQEVSQWPLLKLFPFRQVSPMGTAPGALKQATHVGLDIIAEPGAVVRVSHTGRVRAINAVANGQYILVEHNGGDFLTEYGPLAKTSVAVGQRIPQGLLLGWLRRSGSRSVLHYKRWEHQAGGGYKAVPVVSGQQSVAEGVDLGVALVRMVQARHLAKSAVRSQ